MGKNYKGTTTGEMLDDVLYGRYDSSIGKIKFKAAKDSVRTFAVAVDIVQAPADVTYSIGSANNSGEKTVTLGCETNGVTIRYNVTSDGTTPADPTATSGTVYTSSGITLTPNPSATTTTHKIKAVAVKNGEVSETITTIETTTARRVAKPTINIDASGANVTVSLSCSDAIIVYTTNGTNPAASWKDGTLTITNGTQYTAALDITSATANIKATAYKLDWATSAQNSVTQDIFRYGFAGETINADGVAALTAKKGAPAGTYTINKTTTDAQYTWFACKTDASITLVKDQNGFEVSLEAADTTAVLGWKLYRSSNDAAAVATYTYVVS